MIGAKAQPTNTLLPVLAKRKNVTLRNGCWVRRVYDKANGGRATWTTSPRREVVQPADLVILGPGRSTTRACCCSPASASPTTPRPERASSAAI